VICLDEVQDDNLFRPACSSSDVKHSICQGCAKGFCEHALHNNGGASTILPRCPCPGCTSTWSMSDISTVGLPPKQLELFRERVEAESQQTSGGGQLYDSRELEDMISFNLVQRCQHCRAPTIRNGGCPHMTCSRCNQSWRWNESAVAPGWIMSVPQLLRWPTYLGFRAIKPALALGLFCLLWQICSVVWSSGWLSWILVACMGIGCIMFPPLTLFVAGGSILWYTGGLSYITGGILGMAFSAIWWIIRGTLGCAFSVVSWIGGIALGMACSAAPWIAHAALWALAYGLLALAYVAPIAMIGRLVWFATKSFKFQATQQETALEKKREQLHTTRRNHEVVAQDVHKRRSRSDRQWTRQMNPSGRRSLNHR